MTLWNVVVNMSSSYTCSYCYTLPKSTWLRLLWLILITKSPVSMQLPK
jgi:hypothetical protein